MNRFLFHGVKVIVMSAVAYRGQILTVTEGKASRTGHAGGPTERYAADTDVTWSQ
jgi:hypothetical protein